jgi:hypothetical protein
MTSKPQHALLALADRVRNAEDNLRENALKWATSKVADIARYLEGGQALNSLGELQGTGPGVDVGCARLEASVEAFKVAWNYLSQDVGTDEVGFLEHAIAKSPRLTREVERMNAEAVRQASL